jgi:hypothetical protein
LGSDVLREARLLVRPLERGQVQFEKLGDKAMVGAFADRAEMDRLKAEAAEKGK